VATFSNTNKNAPRILQSVTDTDLEVEVKFSSPLGQPPAGAWKIQGMLFRDTASVAGQSRWLRVELNTDNVGNSPSINYYIGYIDENGALHDIYGPATISASQMNASPLYLRVRYVSSSNTWSVGYRLGDSGTFPYRRTFNESDPITGLPSGFSFQLTDVGVFAGVTGSNPPGIQARVDYIRNVADTITDDGNTITVTKAGNGQGNVNWPLTSPSQCSGNRVSLTASPTGGSTFTGWSGDVTSANATIQLTMNRAYNLTATFTGGSPVEQPFDHFIPYIRR
jgi:hypothetical protein